jgi:hypothetical protein
LRISPRQCIFFRLGRLILQHSQAAKAWTMLLAALRK